MCNNLAFQAVEFCIAKDAPVFLWGKPGTAKSDSVHAIGKRLGLPVHDWRANLREPVDARGLPVADMATKTTEWLMPSDLPFVGNDRFPDALLLFLDELNTAGPSMQTVAFQLTLERRVGEFKLKPGVRIIAAGNRQSDRGTAQRMATPLANRFVHVDWEPDHAAWCQWAARNNIAPVVLAFIRFRPGLLHLMPGEAPACGTIEAIPAGARAFPTLRSWARVSDFADAPDSIRHVLVAGAVGDGPAGEFEGFMRMWRTLPPIADIIANPDGVPVPTDPGTLYAVVSALGRKADRVNFANVLRYGARLPKEFGIVLATDAFRRDESLKQTKAGIDWTVANQDVLL